MKYIVAINQNEANKLADLAVTDFNAAKKWLEEVKAPPTDSYYANQYKIYTVK